MIEFKETKKYDISNDINRLLLFGQNFKRKGDYKIAEKIYLDILEVDGPSGILYIAMAKNFACQEKYDLAIHLFELANKACNEEFNVDDENCLYHIKQLKGRKEIEKNDFLNYMRSISGNPNYNFKK